MIIFLLMVLIINSFIDYFLSNSVTISYFYYNLKYLMLKIGFENNLNLFFLVR